VNHAIEAAPVSTPARAPTCARPQALLTTGGYYGTLAAARSLGRRGIGVVLADGEPLAPTRWSRHVAYSMDCPPIESAPSRFIEWLLLLGAREPGRVLLATSDCTAWMFARYRNALARYFRLSLPPSAAMYTLLNKWRLYEACVELGIDAPRTWLPEGEHDLSRVRREARFPVVIKPQTQALLVPHHKGLVVPEASALGSLYGKLVSSTAHPSLLTRCDPRAPLPVVQAYVETGQRGIYALSGFIDESGELFVVRASRKVLQWPTRLGVGLCFESAEVLPSLAACVARLCRHVGYFGPFEVEFVGSEGKHQLIDFNPRFFGQMGFDASRGLDLAYLAYLAATGERTELEQAVRLARQETGRGSAGVYCHRIDLELSLGLLRCAGRISREDSASWHAWLTRNRVTDAVLDRDDWGPGLAEAAAALVRRAIHPRSTWRCASSY
jgi:predicted ATP-grasp superfamily ATP-dependent carboligase